MNHSWYIVVTHMKAKHTPIRPPASMTMKANGWISLDKFQELLSCTMATNGSASTVHLNHTGRT